METSQSTQIHPIVNPQISIKNIHININPNSKITPTFTYDSELCFWCMIYQIDEDNTYYNVASSKQSKHIEIKKS